MATLVVDAGVLAVALGDDGSLGRGLWNGLPRV
jgi:hypothetical protein